MELFWIEGIARLITAISNASTKVPIEAKINIIFSPAHHTLIQ